MDLPADNVPLPGEPILFGIFYVIVFLLLEWITKMVKRTISNSSGGNVE